MANYCDYVMKVVGDDAGDVARFIDAMKWRGEFQENGVGRVYDCESDDGIVRRIDGVSYIVELYGDCAWSIQSSMLEETNKNNIRNLSRRFGLLIEVWGAEEAAGLQEHYIIEKGNMLIEDWKPWDCINLIDVKMYVEDGDYEDEDACVRAWFEEDDLTYDEVVNNWRSGRGDDDDVRERGGFEEWGKFEI